MNKYTTEKMIEINKIIEKQLINLYIDLKNIEDDIDLNQSFEITNDKNEIKQYIENLRKINEDLQTKLQIKEEEAKINGEN